MGTTATMKRVYIETFGCQMNKLDSELILGRLMQEEYILTKNKNDADVILFNTCSVRKHAEDKAFSHIGSLKFQKRKNPRLIIGVVGCMAQNYKHKIIERASHVDLVVGTHRFGSIPQLIKEVENSGVSRINCEDSNKEFLDIFHTEYGRETPFQSYVKIMEGCNCSCSFCVVPFVRGKEISRQPQEIIDEIKKLAFEGCVEITLLGQTVNSYGLKLKPKTNLGELLYKVSDVEGIKRIGFITSHPSFVQKKLIDAIRDLPKVCRYLHIPAQSGSNRILKLMRRGYTAEEYLDIVNELRENVKDIEIASDFIVGFPTEIDGDFQDSIELMEKISFRNSFIFKYSSRPCTEAANLKDDVPYIVKKERNQTLLDIQKKISLVKNKELIGKVVEILVEGPTKTNSKRLMGRTNTNAIVVFDSGEDLIGRFINVKITNVTHLTLFGEVV